MRTIQGPLCKNCGKAMKRVNWTEHGQVHGRWRHEAEGCAKPDVTWRIKNG